MPVAINYSKIRRNRYALTHNWNLRIEGGVRGEIFGLLKNRRLEELITNFGGVDGFINISCTSATLPNSTVRIATSEIRGVPVHQVVGRDGLQGSIQLSALEYSDYRLHKFFEAWKHAAVHRFTLAQDPYARIADGVYLDLLDSDKSTVTTSYSLLETYCTESSTGSLSSNPSLVETKFTLTYMNYDIISKVSAGGIKTEDDLGDSTSLLWH